MPETSASSDTVTTSSSTSSSSPAAPLQQIQVQDVTPHIRQLLTSSGLYKGTITVHSRHTTTSIVINEWESRLARDVATVLLQLVPPDERSATTIAASRGMRYQHNDLDERPESAEEAQRCRDNGWQIDDPAQLQAWRAQEPINAHSHLLSMLLGSSECIPVHEGQMMIGQWQSVLLVDLDGPRTRTVGIQLMGYRRSE
jgi:thiamine phosphate synthase YjbQ (UPF0047 family)